MSDIESRARGALMGLACGDAVGTTLEFRPPGSFAPIDEMVGGGPFGLEPGQWTDDTSLALCLAESILDVGGMDIRDQHRRYRMWRDEGYLSSNGRCFDIGVATGTQLARAERSDEPVDPVPDQESAGNGSIMRLAPVPIRWHHDPVLVEGHSATSSCTTHPAARPTDACRLLGGVLATLIREGAADVSRLGEIVAGLPLDPTAATALHPQIAAIRDGSFRTKEPPEIRGTGFVVDALEAALWSVAGATGVEDAILRAANLGDDADTTAAIAGQIAGALFGEESIPARWSQRVARAERIGSLADGLLRSATGRISTWGHESTIHAWWVEPGRFLAGEYPGAPDSGGARRKIDILVDAGIRSFVDLTTPEDRLESYAGVLEDVASARDLELSHHRRPIPDIGVIDDSGYDAILDLIAAEIDGGRPVFLHCWGGVGRTGTVVGSHLVRGGFDADGAIGRLTSLRDGTSKAHRPCPETPAQVDVIRQRAQ